MKGRKPVDVLIISSSDPVYDTRSSKFYSALLQAGYSARLVGITDEETNLTNNWTVRGITRAKITSRSGKKFFFQFYRKIIPLVYHQPARIVIAADLFAIPPAIIAKKKFSNVWPYPKLVYDSKELYSELPSLKMKKTSFYFWTIIEKISSGYIDHLLTVNESIANLLSQRWRKKITVIMNVPDCEIAETHAHKDFDTIYLAFSGGMQRGRGITNLVKLLSYLPTNYHLKLIGDGDLTESIVELSIKQNVADRVHMLGRVKNYEVVSQLRQAHIGIYLMENTGLCHYLALPNKLFQYICAGLPVVASDFPEMKRIIDRYKVGITVSPENLKAVAGSIRSIIEDDKRYDEYRANCIKASEELNWNAEKDKFIEIIDSLLH
ncbi:MAG: glycosyltransferase [Candidatus Kryptoniota bacterium]